MDSIDRNILERIHRAIPERGRPLVRVANRRRLEALIKDNYVELYRHGSVLALRTTDKAEPFLL
jgi:hypothetical protein